MELYADPLQAVRQGTTVLRQVQYSVYGTAGYHSTLAGKYSVYGTARYHSTLAGTVHYIRDGRVPQYFSRYCTVYTVQQGTIVLWQVQYSVYGTAGYHSTLEITVQCIRYRRVPQYFGRCSTAYTVRQGTTVLWQVPQYFGRYSTVYTVRQGTTVLWQVQYSVYGTAGYLSTLTGTVNGIR